MTLGIAKKNEQELADWLSTEAGFLAGLGSVEGEPLILETYQTSFLQDRSRFRWVVKSRQVGYSFLFACEALARCHLRPKHTAVFISFNQEGITEFASLDSATMQLGGVAAIYKKPHVQLFLRGS